MLDYRGPDNFMSAEMECFPYLTSDYTSKNVFEGTRPVPPERAEALRKVARREPRDILPDLETIAAAVLGIACGE